MPRRSFGHAHRPCYVEKKIISCRTTSRAGKVGCGRREEGSAAACLPDFAQLFVRTGSGFGLVVLYVTTASSTAPHDTRCSGVRGRGASGTSERRQENGAEEHGWAGKWCLLHARVPIETVNGHRRLPRHKSNLQVTVFLSSDVLACLRARRSPLQRPPSSSPTLLGGIFVVGAFATLLLGRGSLSFAAGEQAAPGTCTDGSVLLGCWLCLSWLCTWRRRGDRRVTAPRLRRFTGGG